MSLTVALVAILGIAAVAGLFARNRAAGLRGGGGAGFASSLARTFWIKLTKRNSTAATMRKLMVMVRKLPHASTAPCFLASTRESAVTLLDSATK